MICTWKCRQLAVVSGMPNRGFPCSYELLVNGDQQCRRDTDPDAAVSSSPSPPTVCPIEGCYTPIPSAHPARTRSVTHHHPSPPPLPTLYYPRRPVGPLQRYGAVRSAGADRALPPPRPSSAPSSGQPQDFTRTSPQLALLPEFRISPLDMQTGRLDWRGYYKLVCIEGLNQ